ncbi:hypothetical protein EBS80_01345 [bacterium]|nr:hypothetical protein [bacterium]
MHKLLRELESRGLRCVARYAADTEAVSVRSFAIVPIRSNYKGRTVIAFARIEKRQGEPSSVEVGIVLSDIDDALGEVAKRVTVPRFRFLTTAHYMPLRRRNQPVLETVFRLKEEHRTDSVSTSDLADDIAEIIRLARPRARRGKISCLQVSLPMMGSSRDVPMAARHFCDHVVRVNGLRPYAKRIAGHRLDESAHR